MSTTPTQIMETTAAVIQETTALEAALNKESIKGMMDAFDPAALLPDLSEVFTSLEPVCRWAVMIGPIVLLLLGLSYLFFAPKEANYYFGYRCYFGMGSVYAWRFTQRFAGVVLAGLGLILTIVMFTITAKFSSMDVTDMVWRAVSCLVWEAALAFLANVTIHLTAAYHFDRKGHYRRKKKKE